MKALIGYWTWNAGERAMVRPDHAAVRYLGVDPDRLRAGHSLWLQFEVALPDCRLEVPVEQRLVGRDTNFRALWYRVVFRKPAPPYPIWVAAERLIADALACWPRGELIDGHPTGVGIQGGFRNAVFEEGFYRLYLPTYVGSPQLGGVALPPPRDPAWTFSPPGARCRQVDLRAAAARGFAAFTQAARAAADAYPAVTSGGRSVILTPGEHAMVRLVYSDETFGSGRFLCSGPYRGQEWLWSIFESGGGVPDVAASSAGRAGAFAAFERLFSPRVSSRSTRKRPEPLTREQQERAYSAFHDALLAVPEGAIQGERLRSPPLVVKSTAPWQRAGYVNLECLTATSLAGSELQAALADDPEPDQLLESPAGSSFDPDAGLLRAPDGSSLALEAALDWRGVTPGRLKLRCRHQGLDWPVFVHRNDRRPKGSWDYRHQLLSRWMVDHDESLHAWRQEGHAGLPPADEWDCMRQFIEDAILSWGDAPAAGPAPQSLATSGGWYEGEWRGPELQRLLARPLRTERVTRTDEWQPYSPARLWRRTDATPQDQPEVPSYGYDLQRTPPVPFEKIAGGAVPARLFASAWLLTQNREEQSRTDLVDFQDGLDHVRLGGSRYRMASAGLIRVDENTPGMDEHGMMRWPARARVELPGLLLWRRLRDAGEGGLRVGESVRVSGGYFFDRLHADSIRVTSLGAEIEDFDHRMFSFGIAFGG